MQLKKTKQENRGLEFGDFKYYLCFESLNVKIGIRTNNLNLLNKLRKLLPSILPIKWREISGSGVERWYTVVKGKKTVKGYSVYKETELLMNDQALDEVMNLLESQIRMTIAEFAEEYVFLHAGAVSWREKAIIIPGKSFSGKTTLVSELIKRDCEYLSDEYAMIDGDGLVHPFPKKLSLRGIIDDFKQVDFEVEDLGGKRHLSPLPVGYLLLTEFKKKTKRHEIKINSVGQGIMASVANSISVRHNPKFVLEVLSIVVNHAIVLQAERGEAKEFAGFLLDYLEVLEDSKDSRQKLKIQI